MDKDKFTCFPELTSERLHLVKQTKAHQQQVFELLSDPDVTKFYDLHLTDKQAST